MGYCCSTTASKQDEFNVQEWDKVESNVEIESCPDELEGLVLSFNDAQKGQILTSCLESYEQQVVNTPTTGTQNLR